MRSTNSNIKTFAVAMAVLICSALSACGSDKEIEDNYENERPLVTFTINLSSEQASRSEDDPNWGENDPGEIGTSFDNRIASLSAVLYEVEGNKINTSNPVGEVVNISSQTNASGDLTIIGILNSNRSRSELENGSFRLAVFANISDVNPLAPDKVSFALHGAPESSFNAIPMYGVGEASFKGISSSPATVSNPYFIRGGKLGNTLLSIPLLRAMAQARVKISQDLFSQRDMKLVSLSLSRHSAKGWLVPSKWDELSDMTDLSMEGSINLCDEGDAHLDCTVVPTLKESSTKNNSWTLLRLYVPDTANADIYGPLSDDEICLTVKYFADNEEEAEDIKTGRLYFRPYVKGKPSEDAAVKPWNIVRNHIYEFTISGINPKGETLEVTVDTSWWGEHILDLD